MSDVRALPIPDVTSDPYWAAARDGRLLIQRCIACGLVFAYARPFCPACWAAEPEWIESNGSATLYTWSQVFVNDLPAFKDLVPYLAAIVDLDEGPRLTSIVQDCDPNELAIGMPLTVAFWDVGDVSLPVFRPRVG